MNLTFKRKMAYNKPELEYIELHKIVLCNSNIGGGASTADFEIDSTYVGGMD